MKTINTGFSLLLTGCLIAGGIFILPPKAKSQDTVQKKPPKMVTIKMKVDGENESIYVDTSFTVTTELDMVQLEAYLNRMEKKMKRLDELNTMIDVRTREKGARSPRIYAYGDIMHPRVADMKRSRKKENLADVMGYIPMDAVTKYDVKKTRNGRRYIIEVNDYYRL